MREENISSSLYPNKCMFALRIKKKLKMSFFGSVIEEAIPAYYQFYLHHRKRVP
jgi:hypothetical protein